MDLLDEGKFIKSNSIKLEQVIVVFDEYVAFKTKQYVYKNPCLYSNQHINAEDDWEIIDNYGYNEYLDELAERYVNDRQQVEDSPQLRNSNTESLNELSIVNRAYDVI